MLRELNTKRFSLSLRHQRLFPKAPFQEVNPIAQITVPVLKLNHSPMRLTAASVLVVSEADRMLGDDLLRIRKHARKAGARIVFLTDWNGQELNPERAYEIIRERERAERRSSQQQSQSQSQSR